MKSTAAVLVFAVGCSLTHSLDDITGGSELGAPAGGVGGTAGAAGGSGGTDAGGEPSGSSGSTGAGEGGEGGEGGSPTATGPRLVATSADSGSLGFLESLELTFSDAMAAESITTNTTLACTGSVQLSTDASFESCVRMKQQPSVVEENVFSVTPLAPLEVGVQYFLRVTSTAETATGTALAPDQERDFTAAYRHTIVIDGTNDFLDPVETFPTSTTGYTGYVAWDDDALYVGMKGARVASSNESDWVLVYLGVGLSGGLVTKTGQTYKSQTPALSFDASYHLRWKANNAFTTLMTYSYGTWNDGAAFTDQVYRRLDDFVEMRLAWAQISNPTTLSFVMTMLNEGTTESTDAAVPSNALEPGSAGPIYSKHFEFDLSGAQVPADHQPL